MIDTTLTSRMLQVEPPHPESHRLSMDYLPAHAVVPQHEHSVDVTIVVLRGGLAVHVDGHAHWLRPHQHVLIPAEHPHTTFVGRHNTEVALINHTL